MAIGQPAQTMLLLRRTDPCPAGKTRPAPTSPKPFSCPERAMDTDGSLQMHRVYHFGRYWVCLGRRESLQAQILVGVQDA